MTRSRDYGQRNHSISVINHAFATGLTLSSSWTARAASSVVRPALGSVCTKRSAGSPRKSRSSMATHALGACCSTHASTCERGEGEARAQVIKGKSRAITGNQRRSRTSRESSSAEVSRAISLIRRNQHLRRAAAFVQSDAIGRNQGRSAKSSAPPPSGRLRAEDAPA